MNRLSRSFKIIVLLSCTILVLAIVGISQTKIPDTPAGKKLAGFLAAVESGDVQKMRMYAQSFSSSLLDKMPVEEHVSFFQQAHQYSGGFDVVKIEEDSDHELSALLKCKNSSGYRFFAVRTEAKPPYAVVDMSYGMADVPDPSAQTPPPPTASEAADPDAVVRGRLGKEIDELMLQKMKNGFSGAVLVAENGEKVIHKGYGWAVRERKLPVTTQTVFDIGSISKPFTATAVMKLRQEGKLKVSDPITAFFDEVPDDKKAITIHHLLTHSAGLGEYHDTRGDFEEMTRDEAVQHIFNQKLKFTPGTDYAYSNSGFTLLAVIVEKLSGQSFKKFLKDKVFDPAGMTRTGFYRNPSWKKENDVQGYNDRKLGKENSPLKWPEITWALLGNGGLVSTVEDLFKFHVSMKGTEIFSQKTKRESYTGHVKIGEDVLMGYGWGIRSTNHGKRVSHGGANDFGFQAMFIRFLDEDTVIVITTNAGRVGDIRNLQNEIEALVFQNKKN